MIDHVTIRASDRAASAAFYGAVLSALDVAKPDGDLTYVEWRDFSLAAADPEHPPTRNLHLGFVAPSRAHVDAFHAAGVAAGWTSGGAPGERDYTPDYYGAFLLDPDGNSAEATHHTGMRDDGGVIDHLWLRVADPAASAAFYEAIAGPAGLEVRRRGPERTHVRTGGGSLTLVAGTPPTAHVHLAFGTAETARVDAFHAAGVAAGGVDNGGPGERPEYHPGYYGAFVLDPDGHNVELVDHRRP